MYSLFIIQHFDLSQFEVYLQSIRARLNCINACA